jgi:endonuclease YncB( thermonuclease family)
MNVASCPVRPTPKVMAGWFRLMTFACVFAILSQEGYAEDWLRGSPKVVNDHVLAIDGYMVILYGVRSKGEHALCDKGRNRFPCSTLAKTELARLVSSRKVLCNILDKDPDGNFIGSCVADDLDLAVELLRAGLVEVNKSQSLLDAATASPSSARSDLSDLQNDPAQDPLSNSVEGNKQEAASYSVDFERPAGFEAPSLQSLPLSTEGSRIPDVEAPQPDLVPVAPMKPITPTM